MIKLKSLFSIEYGQREYHSKGELEQGITLLISSQGVDNGAYGFFDISPKYIDPIITVPSTGSIGMAFVQVQPCCVDDNCLVLVPLQKMSIEYLYYAATKIRREKWRYVYGRQITPYRLGKLEVQPPEEYKNIINFDTVRQKLIPPDKVKTPISITRTKDYPLSGDKGLCLIDRKYAPYLNQIDLSVKRTPYITTTEEDNGISLYCNEEANFKKGTVTVALDGACGITFYQLDDFISGEKTAVLQLKDKNNPYLLMYIAAIIRIKSWRYHYGRKLSMGRLLKLEIPLPVNDDAIDLDAIRSIVRNCYGSQLFEKYMVK